MLVDVAGVGMAGGLLAQVLGVQLTCQISGQDLPPNQVIGHGTDPQRVTESACTGQ